MSDLTQPTHPELLVLDALIETCRLTCRLNPSYDVRKAALDHEQRLETLRAKVIARLAQTEEVAA